MCCQIELLHMLGFKRALHDPRITMIRSRLPAKDRTNHPNRVFRFSFAPVFTKQGTSRCLLKIKQKLKILTGREVQILFPIYLFFFIQGFTRHSLWGDR